MKILLLKNAQINNYEQKYLECLSCLQNLTTICLWIY